MLLVGRVPSADRRRRHERGGVLEGRVRRSEQPDRRAAATAIHAPSRRTFRSTIKEKRGRAQGAGRRFLRIRHHGRVVAVTQGLSHQSRVGEGWHRLPARRANSCSSWSVGTRIRTRTTWSQPQLVDAVRAVMPATRIPRRGQRSHVSRARRTGRNPRGRSLTALRKNLQKTLDFAGGSTTGLRARLERAIVNP